MEYKHTPVMVQEIIDHLAIKRGGYYIDCTLGSGVYTEVISEKTGKKGRVLSIDLDERAINNSRQKGLGNVILVQDDFKNIKSIFKKEFGEGVYADGVVFDLGLSSHQLRDRDRGFSFNSDNSLDMSFSGSGSGQEGKSTDYIVNNYKENDLKRIFKQYGEEEDAGRIAKHIIEQRKGGGIKNAKELSRIIADAKRNKKSKIHPATKAFQALRIETNDELEGLSQALSGALSILGVGGSLVVVSFHSLEDRIVKNFFKQESFDCLCPPELPVCRCGHKKKLEILTKKPIRPSEEEVEENPRARSAKLRSAKKI